MYFVIEYWSWLILVNQKPVWFGVNRIKSMCLCILKSSADLGSPMELPILYLYERIRSRTIPTFNILSDDILIEQNNPRVCT